MDSRNMYSQKVGRKMYYHCMTFCPLFSFDNLGTKFQTTGHEMTHTRVADGGKKPHIIDEDVVEPDRFYPGNPAGYGPALVHAAYPSTGCALGVIRACSPKSGGN